MVTKGQAAVGIVGTGGTITFLTYEAWKNRLISLPAWLANILHVPQKNPTEGEKEADKTVSVFKTQSECEAHGFDWRAEKQACVYVTRPSPGEVAYEWKGKTYQVVWTLPKPYLITLLTFRFKNTCLTWHFHTEHPFTGHEIKVEYMDLAGNWHSLGLSGGADCDALSSDNSKSIAGKVTKFRFTAEDKNSDALTYIYGTIL